MPGTLARTTANERFKDRSRYWTRVGMVGAAGLHMAVLALVRFDVAPLAASEEAPLEFVIPAVELPEPPAPIERPARPVIGDVSVTATIAPTDFDDVEPRDLAPPPRAAGAEGRVRFIPYDRAPVLRNGEEIGRLLEREYPERLRRAGIEGRVELWLFVGEDGRVSRSEVKTSSGESTLDEAAIRVAAEMRFEPARNMDRTTAVWVSQWVTFVIR